MQWDSFQWENFRWDKFRWNRVTLAPAQVLRSLLICVLRIVGFSPLQMTFVSVDS